MVQKSAVEARESMSKTGPLTQHEIDVSSFAETPVGFAKLDTGPAKLLRSLRRSFHREAKTRSTPLLEASAVPQSPPLLRILSSDHTEPTPSVNIRDVQ